MTESGALWTIGINKQEVGGLMILTAQINEHACVLACLESFLRENGVPVSQQKIVQEMPEVCFGSDHRVGCVAIGENPLAEFGERYGFSVTMVDQLDLASPSVIPPGETYLLVFGSPPNHCLRVIGRSYQGPVIVMNPQAQLIRCNTCQGSVASWTAAIEYWNEEVLKSRQAFYLHLKMI